LPKNEKWWHPVLKGDILIGRSLFKIEQHMQWIKTLN